MRGLMQDRPLDVSLLMRRVERLFGHKRIITATWAEAAGRARRIAAALDPLDVPRHARVGTFGWNSAQFAADRRAGDRVTGPGTE